MNEKIFVTCGDCKYHKSNWKGEGKLIPCTTPKETEAWSNACFEGVDEK